MKIEVMGPGCPKCHSTGENVKKALAELGTSAEVVHITDINTMIGRGVMWTPALAIDGRVVMQGKMPTVEEIKQLIKKEA